MEYYDRLQAVRDQGDYERWLKFFLRGVADISNQATEIGRAIVQLREEHRQYIISSLERSSHNALNLLEFLFQVPVISVHKASEVMKVSYANANRLVSGFQDLGILDEVTGRRRNRLFRYSRYIEMFERK
jgi:Fic family protein